jgi:hypothetical protein
MFRGERERERRICFFPVTALKMPWMQMDGLDGENFKKGTGMKISHLCV